MSIRVVRLGTPRLPGEGLRIGTVRRPPRGVPREYRAEMARPDARHDLALLAALSHATDFSVGCYCEDESRCHRYILRTLLSDAGARLA